MDFDNSSRIVRLKICAILDGIISPKYLIRAAYFHLLLQVCWTSSTYYLPYSKERIPKEEEPREYISYYQWVAFVLTCQAMLFCLPRIIWRILNKRSGIAVSTITDAAIQCQKTQDTENRDKVLRYMTKHMGRYLLELNRWHMMATQLKKFWLIFYGNYLVILYLFIKVVYIVNALGQLFLLNTFLNTDYHLYGFDVIARVLRNESWTTSDRFPRVTLCDFKVRLLGNIHRYTVQCALPMNLFNEIIFIFLWFWFVFVATATVVSLVSWFITSLFLRFHLKYIRSRLVAIDKIKHRTCREKINKFVMKYLRRDGCFIIRQVAGNASDVIAAELVGGLWEHFIENEKAIDRLFDDNTQLNLVHFTLSGDEEE